MATIKEQAAAIKGYAQDIDAAIVAKGGTTAGGLRHAKDAILALPSGPEPPPKKWWEDENLTVIEITLDSRDTTFKDNTCFPAGTKIWWDCSKGAESYVTKPSSTALTNDYGAAGTYIVAFSNSTASLQGAFRSSLKVTGFFKLASGVTNLREAFSGCRCLVGDIPSLEGITVSLQEAFDYTNISPKVIKLTSKGIGGIYFARTIPVAGCLEVTGVSSSLWFNPVNINKFVGMDLTGVPNFQGSDKLTECIVPKATRFENNGLYGCNRLSYVKTGVLAGTNSSGALTQVGSSLTAYPDGYKTIVEVGNTCASLLSLANFPWGAPTTTKFVCADGYVARIDGAWTAVTEG